MTQPAPIDDPTIMVIVLSIVVFYTYLGGAIGYAIGYRHGQRLEGSRK